MKDQRYKASVIIPLYNQKESLDRVLQFFNYQNYPINYFEVIVINDGSTDGVDDFLANKAENYHFPLKVINQVNKGRAAARNRGIKESSGEILIFCDADRIPDKQFVNRHISAHTEHERAVVIGASYDYFGGFSRLESSNTNQIKKFSRLPQYFKKVSTLYNQQQSTSSPIAWITFLVGNSSIKRKHIDEVGWFNERFRHWGFEHFELAIRLMDNGFQLLMYKEIMNFHLPHKRDKEKILQQFEISCKILEELHPTKKVSLLNDFMIGKISLQYFEENYNNDSTSLGESQAEEIYFYL
ncbi:glycosyltransferase [Paenibacillus humicus]|uniref:glycosyltransferase n=1 Tax=Paenibacillus humicus TaxID=412861 RepID=UPI003D2A185A